MLVSWVLDRVKLEFIAGTATAKRQRPGYTYLSDLI
jgi:hypothetical protein